MKLIPQNWKDFQHYKHRSPPWVKLHKSLLDDFEFQCLPVASRALAPMLWLLASETDCGTIEAMPEKLAFRLRMNEEDFLYALKPLIEKGFFKETSKMLARCKQDAKTEKSKSREENRVEKINSQAATASDDIKKAFDYYNLIAEETGLPKAIELNDTRKRNLKCRLKEINFDGWKQAMDKISLCPHLMGDNDRNWKASLDFFLKKASLLKHMEGQYEQSNNNTADRERDRRRKAIVSGLAS